MKSLLQIMRIWGFSILVALLSLETAKGAESANPPSSPSSPDSVPAGMIDATAKRSIWEGFERLDFVVDGRACLLVRPKTSAPAKPWIWRTEFFGHEPQVDAALLGQGFHVAYMDVQNLYGAPVALDAMDRFHARLTKEFGLSSKVVLEGLSRGGLFAFNWAARHPDRTACLYVDAPVCDFKSWPAGWGKGPGSPADWERCKKVYGLTDDQARAYNLNPVDNLAPLAQARIPILSVCGGADEAVPMAENTLRVQERYNKLGGPITVITKPSVGHHPHSLKEPKRIVDFILRATSGAALQPGELTGSVLLPNCVESREARMQWWRDAKFGLFVHWGPASVNGTEISWSRIGHPFDHRGMETVPPEVYDNLYKQFNPVKFDADAWMRMAKEAGMKYVVFITKHHDGFSMWPTKLRADYSIAATPFQRDICREVADAAHKYGLKLGWYYSTRDWTHPDYLKDGNAKYNDFYHGQIRELLSNYGKVDMLWFDHVAGNWRDYRFQELFDMICQLQPGIMVNNRAAAFIRGTEDRPTPELASLVRGDFDTPEQRIGVFQNQRAWESCVTMTECKDGGGWSYRPEGQTRSFDECLRMLVNCVTGDGNLLLNVGPLPTGEIDPQQVAVLKRTGQWLGQYGDSLYATSGGPFRNGKWGGATFRDKTVFLHIFRWDGDTLRLPPLKAKVLRATALTGGTVKLEQTTTGLEISLPHEQQDKTDTVIKLELDAPAQAEFVKSQPLEVAATSPLMLDSPLDYQVFQRQTLQSGHIHLSGHAPKSADKLEARLMGKSRQGELPGSWISINFDQDSGQFHAEMNVAAGGWYTCEVRAFRQGKMMGSAQVPHVGVGEVFVVAGQSNSANHGSPRQQVASGKVAAFDGAKWQVAYDPQPGASGSGGSFIPAFGDDLVAKYAVPVGVICLGVGATSVREWLPKGERMTHQPTTGAHVIAAGPREWAATGELFDRLSKPLQALGPRGCRAILWHQGESDAGQAREGYPADRQISGEQYRQFMAKLIQAARQRAGWDVPWFVAQATYHSEKDPADEEFRAGQAALWRDGLALAGPDTDALRAEYRDGVHFNAQGLRRHGELWAEKVSAWLDGAIK